MAEAQTKLLSGEDPLSPHAEDARHWANVYQDLLELVTAVLRQATQGSSDPLTGHSATEVAFIEARVETLQSRLDFWRQRLAEVDQEPTP